MHDPASAGFNRRFDKVAGVSNGSVERDVSTLEPNPIRVVEDVHIAQARNERTPLADCSNRWVMNLPVYPNAPVTTSIAALPTTFSCACGPRESRVPASVGGGPTVRRAACRPRLGRRVRGPRGVGGVGVFG